ncbi:MarR family transcriptional regulator [Streptomyces sp. NPDC086838]|uniref:MarR family transcriptional regulator n=1 Tax=Streptomyces sp. NPDC086838 TaxID=3365762 RepID=UPI00381FA21D
MIADTADAAGLSEPDLTILVSLSKAGGSLRRNEPAASLGRDRTRISHQFTRMSRRDLIAREWSGGVTVTLTEEGRRTVAAVHPGLEAAVRRHFTDKLTAREAETPDALLRRLQRHGPAA